jgi:hypothetical protein
MTEQEAQNILFARRRDFRIWASLTKSIPYPENIPATEQDVAYLQECFPKVKKNDPEAWGKGGWKRVELDEALAFLNLPPLED